MRWTLASLAATSAVLLVSPEALAQDRPAAPAGPERHSGGMMVAGMVLTGAGVLAAGGGAIFALTLPEESLVQCASAPCPGAEPRKDPFLVALGLGTAIAGVSMVATGIPLWVTGARPKQREARSALRLAVGPGSARLVGSF